MNGVPTTCGSKILEGWRPPYDSTVVRKLREADVVIRRQDEHGRVRDGLVDRELRLRRRPTTRGTSTGSPAVRRAGRVPRSPAFEAPLAIGTDTGGSIRQPAAVTGIVGVKPTYGGGVALRADRVLVVARPGRAVRAHVLDAALLHAAIAGHDPLDSTSIDAPVPDVVAAAPAR